MSVAIADIKVQPTRCVRETRRKGLGRTASKLSGAETGQSPFFIVAPSILIYVEFTTKKCTYFISKNTPKFTLKCT